MSKIVIILMMGAAYLFPQDQKFHQEDFRIFEKFIGAWENIEKEYYSAEIWEKINDSTLSAISYTVKGIDTLSYEKIRLELRGNEINYIPSVRGQNDDLPVKFKLISLENEAVFENKEHDFPQRIIYVQSANELKASIEGIKNGEKRRIDFSFTEKK